MGKVITAKEFLSHCDNYFEELEKDLLTTDPGKEVPAMSNVLSCPFCGDNKIDYSIKTGGRDYRKNGTVYYCTIYCKTCHTYGPRYRTLIDDNTYSGRRKVEKDAVLREGAINLWNTRK